MKRNHFILLIVVAFLLASCAQILTPTGGPRDVVPPKLLNSTPENKSINISENQFQFTFDEFFNLQNPSEKILISPPLQSKPDYKIKGKTLIVSISDTLKANTTYSFVFSDCIRDITENNTLSNFTYVFSTGNFLDSNVIKGKVVNAQTLEPEKNVFILLYKNSDDSLPRTTKPYYITKTGETGFFVFSNLTEGEYSIFALNDKNNNLIFDQIKEPFAFHNSRVKSALANSTSENKEVLLRMFSHLDTVQKIVRTFTSSKGAQTTVFKNPLQNPTLKSINGTINPNRFLLELNSTKDSLVLYDTETTIDTIALQIIDENFTDTIRFITQQESQRKSGRRGAEDKKRLISRFLNTDDLYKPTIIEFDFPVKQLKQNTISIIKNGKDTISAKLTINDSLRRLVSVDFIKEEKNKYSFMILDSIFIGYNSSVNDTLRQSFTTKSESDYGNFFAKIKNQKNTAIIAQLTDEKGILIKEFKIQNTTDLEFKHLKPATYRLFFIFDKNNNGHWDTGNYYQKRQPETKVEFTKRMIVKANWDIEEEIDLDKLFDEIMN